MSTSTDHTPTGHAAWGVGLATTTPTGRVLDTWYQALGLGELPTNLKGPYGVPAGLAALTQTDTVRDVALTVVHTEIDLAARPTSVADAYLRLHLLSHRFLPPFGVNLDGLLQVLPTNAWTSIGPIPVDGFAQVRLRARVAAKGAPLTVHGISQIPRMADYVLPDQVVIADANRVMLGAHLAPGTRVTHEGFVAFNAGTSGAAVIQGRVSTGVIVAQGAEIGGSASLLPSAGQPVQIGERSLIGANSGVGIDLGPDCVVEAGLFLTPGTKVTIRTADHPHPRVIPAHDLAGQAGLLFRRNSTTGVVEAFDRGTDSAR